ASSARSRRGEQLVSDHDVADSRHDPMGEPRSRWWLAGVATLFAAACGHAPVPSDKLDYVGAWKGADAILVIAPDGYVGYVNESGAGTEVRASIRSFQVSGFGVGRGPFGTTFTVSQAPHEVNGDWRMTLNEVGWQRIDDGRLPAMLLRSDSGGLARNPDVTRRLFENACSGAHGPSCANLANMYEQGEGVTKDLTKAAELFRRACDRTFTAGCVHLGRLYRHGSGVPRDPSKTVELWEAECRRGHAT